jgi:hypothetical protein
MTDNASIFSDINWDEGSDNPFGLGPGTYETTISEATIERSEKGNLGLWLTFSSEDGKSIRKWITMPESGQSQSDYSRNTSFLRMSLRSLEIPEAKWPILEPNDFIGLDCIITVAPQKKNPEYNQITKLVRAGVSLPTGSSNGASSYVKPDHTTVPADGGYSF